VVLGKEKQSQSTAFGQKSEARIKKSEHVERAFEKTKPIFEWAKSRKANINNGLEEF